MMFLKQHFFDETFSYAFANILHLNKCMDGTKNSSDMIWPLFKPLCNPKSNVDGFSLTLVSVGFSPRN